MGESFSFLKSLLEFFKTSSEFSAQPSSKSKDLDFLNHFRFWKISLTCLTLSVFHMDKICFFFLFQIFTFQIFTTLIY